MFRNAINKYATTFTTTLFLVSAVSGVFLFFHTAQDIFKAMHEWLSMVLLVPVVFHIYKNWRPLTLYFKNMTFAIPIAVSLVAAIAFGWATAGGGGSPMGRIFQAFENSPIVEVAALFDKTPEAVIAHLQANGIDAAAETDTLKALGAKAGMPPMRLVALISEAK